MYSSPVPLLVVRADAEALVYVNDKMLGECGPARSAALPVSAGDYYVCAQPLLPGRFALTRKLCFGEEGLACAAPDVGVCAWPGGVYECLLQTAMQQGAPETGASRVLQSLGFAGHTLTLYWEGALRLCVEKDGRPLYSYTLCGGASGEMVPYGPYMAVISRTAFGESLLLLDKTMQPALEAQGDAIELGERIAAVTALGTRMGHERRTLYEEGSGGFAQMESEVGFFTHPYTRPVTQGDLALAFFEAVALNEAQEAMGYLAQSLREDCTFAQIVEFLGPYDEARLPFSDGSGSYVGLVSQTDAGRGEARLYALRFAGECIENITET